VGSFEWCWAANNTRRKPTINLHGIHPLDLKNMSLLSEFVSVLIALDVLWPARVQTGIDTRDTLPQADWVKRLRTKTSVLAPGLLAPIRFSTRHEILYKTVMSRGTKVELIFSTKVCTLEPIVEGNHVKEYSWRVDPLNTAVVCELDYLLMRSCLSSAFTPGLLLSLAISDS